MKLRCPHCGAGTFRFLPENGRNERLECTTCRKILLVHPADPKSEGEGIDHLAWVS